MINTIICYGGEIYLKDMFESTIKLSQHFTEITLHFFVYRTKTRYSQICSCCCFQFNLPRQASERLEERALTFHCHLLLQRRLPRPKVNVLPQRSCVRLPPETNKQASKNKDKTMSGDQGFEKFKSRFAAFCGRFVHFCCLIKHDFFLVQY